MTVSVNYTTAGNVDPSLVSQSGTSSPAGATSLAKWRAAFSRARAGLAQAKLLVIGDSWVAGSGAANVSGYAGARAVSFPVKLAAHLTAAGYPARADGFIGSANQAAYSTYDPRITGWTSNTVLNGALGGTWSTTTASAVLAITPAGQWDRAQILYAASNSAQVQGSFSPSIDAGGALTTIFANVAPAIGNYVAIAGAPGVHTLNLTKGNTTINNILGVRFWNTTAPDIEIIQMGRPGGVAADLSVAVQPWDSLNELIYVAPDLTYIECTINDWVAATSTATYTTQIQALITAAKLSGDVILGTGGPSAISSTSLAQQQIYVDICRTLAVTNDCYFIDQWRRRGSYEANTGMYADTLHYNGAGYADYEQAIFQVLTGT